MPKIQHTHLGTCQGCGAVHAVDRYQHTVAKHGYKVVGYFLGVCPGGRDRLPAERDVTLTKDTITNCLHYATVNDDVAAKLRSGEKIPEHFQRWNPKKVVQRKGKFGKVYETKGGYDELLMSQATPDEREKAVQGEIAHCKLNSETLRGHAKMLETAVLPRLGKPLYEREPVRVYEPNMHIVDAKGTEYVIVKRWVSTFGHRFMGWYVQRIGAPKDAWVRWRTSDLNKCTIKP